MNRVQLLSTAVVAMVACSQGIAFPTQGDGLASDDRRASVARAASGSMTLAEQSVSGNAIKITPMTGSGGGQWTAPSVANTPATPGPVPIPYPNTGGTQKEESGAETRAKTAPSKGVPTPIVGQPVITKRSGPVDLKHAGAPVKMEGKPVGRVGSMTGHNGKNANMPSGKQIAPSQSKVIVAQ